MKSILGKNKREDSVVTSDFKRAKEDIDVVALLKQYPETKNVSRNQDLQRIFLELKTNKFRPNPAIVSLIKSQNWKKFDDFCKRNQGIPKFWILLQHLFYLFYFVDENKKIDFDTMQKGLGIQQARWQMDPNNEFQKKLLYNRAFSFGNGFTFHDTLEFNYLKDIITKDQIIERLEDISTEPLDEENFANTIWYRVDFDSKKYFGKVYEDADRSFIVAFGTAENKKYFGIPNSYDVSKYTCLQQPRIVFGKMAPPSMVNFILDYDQRPYVGFLPGSKSNLETFDDITASILMNWGHDFNHQYNRQNCSLNSTLDLVEEECDGLNLNDEIYESNTEGPEVFRNNEEFQKCLKFPILDENGQASKDYYGNDEFDDSVAETLTDDGYIFKKYGIQAENQVTNYRDELGEEEENEATEGGSRKRKKKAVKKKKTCKNKRRKTKRPRRRNVKKTKKN
jgi:hypothetical protein